MKIKALGIQERKITKSLLFPSLLWWWRAAKPHSEVDGSGRIVSLCDLLNKTED